MDILEVKNIWSEIKSELRDVIPAHAFYSWFDSIEPVGFDNNIFSLITVHQLAPQIVRQNYFKQISEALKKHFGHDVDFDIQYDAAFAERYIKEKKKESSKPKSIHADEDEEQKKVLDNLAKMQSFSNLNLKYKFENYVVGENNRFAHAVAMAVAKNPAKKYNPLFIYGASGLGKTHLMQAIGHHILFNKPKLRVKYVKTEEYINEVISSIQKGGDRVSRMDKFRQKFRNVDVLLIDDIQFIESKERTMEEIFHTFESLHNNGKQIVITSDRLPKDIPTLPDRLRTRFEMGIMVELTPPEFETRIAILRNLAEKDGLQIPCDVYDLIAKSYKNNVRELEGAYNRISAFAEIDGAELSIEYVKKVLNCSEESEELTMDSIAQTIAEYYGVTVEDFLSPARSQKISAPRHIVVYMIRELLGASFESIADFLHKKHTTMLYSYEKVRDEMKTNRDLKRGVEELLQTIKG